MGTRVYKNQLVDWERGKHMPMADVMLAALAIAGPNRVDLPSPLGADSGSAIAIDIATRIRDLELKVGELIQFRQRLESLFH